MTPLTNSATNTAGITNTAAYAYDAIGEVTNDLAYQGAGTGGTARLNEQLRYVFDAAGNLAYRTNNALIENFQVNSVNSVNELTANTNGGTLTVMGTTTSMATNVTVNATNTASNYNDGTFAAPNMPLTTNYTVTASDSIGRHATNSVNVNITNNNTAFQYDGNGNLTSDGLRGFAYDNENQLIQVQVTNQWLSEFAYDAKMRRRIRQEYAWQGSQWVLTNTVYYVYDGNEVIQERDVNNLPTVTYTRGKDLSGTLEGAGGIGGLLARMDMASGQPAFYHGDGNGNVTTLINSSNSIVAKYLYDAFGNTISKSGLLADANLYRFSSKEAHPSSGLVYYLYRYYDPHLQRWPNRDPLGEDGGINLYEFAANDPENLLDTLGLQDGMANPANVAALEEAEAAAEGYSNVGEYRAAKAAEKAAEAAAKQAQKNLLKRCTKNIGKLAKQSKKSVKEIRQRIERLKQGYMRGGGGKGFRANPDVQIDPTTGEAYPELPGGGLGESIGNIFD